MSRLFPKPYPEFEGLQIEQHRSAPSCRKLELVWQMNAAVWTLTLSNHKARDPDDPLEEIRRRPAELLLGPDLADKVWCSVKCDCNVCPLRSFIPQDILSEESHLSSGDSSLHYVPFQNDKLKFDD